LRPRRDGRDVTARNEVKRARVARTSLAGGDAPGARLSAAPSRSACSSPSRVCSSFRRRSAP